MRAIKSESESFHAVNPILNLEASTLIARGCSLFSVRMLQGVSVLDIFLSTTVLIAVVSSALHHSGDSTLDS